MTSLGNNFKKMKGCHFMSKAKIPQFAESLWRATTNPINVSSLNESIKTDIVIVGAGITGITAAYLLAKQNLNIVLIDRRKLLDLTTARTTGKITAQHGLIYDELIQNIGLEGARLYYEAQNEAIQLVEQIIEDESIPCHFEIENSYLFTNKEEELEKLEKEAKAYDQLKIPYEIVDSLPIDIPKKIALKLNHQAQFHPLEYLNSLLKIIIQKGVKVYQETTAIDIEHLDDLAVVTADGNRIIAKYVIQASHYPFYDGEKFFPVRMYPERSYLIAIESESPYPSGMYISAEEPTRSIRNIHINGTPYLFIGGENHKTGQGKDTMEHYLALQRYAKDHFGIKQFLYRWSAQDYITIDKIPYIGSLEKNENRIFVATGFRKWGMTNGTIAAKIITDLITTGTSIYEQLFTPTRFHMKSSMKTLVTENLDVARHLIQGKLEQSTAELADLKKDESMIIRSKGMRAGVYKDESGKLYAVDTTCTHLGCEVHWNSGERTWDCPCHGSRFSYTGEVLEGPAKKPLNKVILDQK